MNAYNASTHALAGTLKHGAGRIGLLALGGTIVAGAVVIAVAARPSSGSDTRASTTTNAPMVEVGRAPRSSAVDPTPLRTTYLVRDQEQADAMALANNDANLIRVATGLAPTLDTFLVVGSDAEAAAVAAALADGNLILVGLGEPEEYVVDLRGGVGGSMEPTSESDSLSDASTQMSNPLYPANREGVRGHVDLDTPFVAASGSARSTSGLPNYPASREGVRGHVAFD